MMYLWGYTLDSPVAQTWKQDEIGTFDLMFPGYEEEALLTSEDSFLLFLRWFF